MAKAVLGLPKTRMKDNVERQYENDNGSYVKQDSASDNYSYPTLTA
jgi:hypothetical protein